MPVCVRNIRKRILRRHIYASTLRILGEQAHNCHLSAHGFSGAGGGAHEHVLVTIVDGVEYIGNLNKNKYFFLFDPITTLAKTGDWLIDQKTDLNHLVKYL